MTGPEHYAEAERLLTLADRHASGATYGPEWTLTLTAAQVHAMLALTAATAVGTTKPRPPFVGRRRCYQLQRQHGRLHLHAGCRLQRLGQLHLQGQRQHPR